MIVFFFQLFIPCYFGDAVMRKSADLHGGAYAGNWTLQTKNFKVCLGVFIERAYNPVIMKTWKGLIQINMLTFGRVCQFIYYRFNYFKLFFFSDYE